MTELKPTHPTQAWLIVLWLVCFLVVIGFALFSYFAGWMYPHVE